MPFDKGHALIVGVGTYQDARWDVPVTRAEASSLTAVLTNPNVAGYPPSQARLLKDGQATRSNFLDALDALGRDVSSSDTVLIFFSGHGVMGEDDQYYLTTHDTRFSPAGYAVRGTGVSETALLDKLRGIKASKVLVLLNACFSGNVRGALGPDAAGPGPATLGTPPAEELRLGVLASGEGRAVITACRSSQSSWFDPHDPSATFFGQALVDGLRGHQAVAATSQFVGLFELYAYVHSSVVTAAGRIQKVQEPVLNIVEGVGPFPVSLRRPTARRLGLPDVTPEREPETIPEAAEVIGLDRLLDYKLGTQPLDQDEDVIGFFHGKHLGGVGQLLVTNRRVFIGSFVPTLVTDVEAYLRTPGHVPNAVAEALHRLLRSRPRQIPLGEVTTVEAVSGGFFKAPSLVISTTAQEALTLEIFATPLSIVWSPRNREARDRAVEVIRKAMADVRTAANQ